MSSDPLATVPPPAARVIVTVGLHGSASTWAFNVARELMIAAFGADHVASFFADTPAGPLAEPASAGRHLVCKTHGWPNVQAFAAGVSAAVIITVRDPRDCVFSLMERFGSPIAAVLQVIACDCQHAIACADAGHPVLRHEDRFFEDRATVRMLARHLRVEVSDVVADAIFERYETAAGRAATVPSLPPERRSGDGKPLLFDPATQRQPDGMVGHSRMRATYAALR
jgi:hypothetical protein